MEELRDNGEVMASPEIVSRERYDSLGQRLLRAGFVNEAQLREGLEEHRRTGVRIGEALIALGHARDDAVVQVLADKHALSVLDPRAIAMDDRFVEMGVDDWYREHRIVPMASRRGVTQVATTDPTNQRELDVVRHKVGRPIAPVIATNRDMERALHLFNFEPDVRMSTRYLRDSSPENSAHRVLTRPQKIVILCMIGLLVGAAIVDWRASLVALTSGITILYLAASVYKLYLLYLGESGNFATGHSILADEAQALSERELPFYTILVPLYKEARILPQLMNAIRALDWPKAKLDVRILLEEDDEETIEAAHSADLPAFFTLVIVPKNEPRGKPKACNYGLRHARGDFVVIYDAEDIPESDQLRKAYALFMRSGSHVACLQARLDFYNPTQNLLTRWFTAEYSMWFSLLLHGLQRAGAPVPLGGTSNHFRREALDSLGAWDPYNVTEDADLGIRLFKRGYQTMMLDSATLEEANPRLGNWIRQRSRWIKGYFQTWLVHMRHPIALWRSLGWRGFLGFQCFIGGTCFVLLLNPFYWVLVLLWFVTRWAFIEYLFPGPIFYLASLALFVGNFVFVYLTMSGPLSRGYSRLVKYSLLSPIYWIFMSIAAWKGCLQLIYAPSYWEKTEHGLATTKSVAAEAITTERVS